LSSYSILAFQGKRGNLIIVVISFIIGYFGGWKLNLAVLIINLILPDLFVGEGFELIGIGLRFARFLKTGKKLGEFLKYMGRKN